MRGSSCLLILSNALKPLWSVRGRDILIYTCCLLIKSSLFLHIHYFILLRYNCHHCLNEWCDVISIPIQHSDKVGRYSLDGFSGLKNLQKTTTTKQCSISKLAFCFHSAGWFDGSALSLLVFFGAATLNTEILPTLPAAEMLLMPGLAIFLMPCL